MIVIVDYGMGNIGSILNMLKRVGAQAKISSAVEDIAAAGKLILPGVGAFDTGMQNLCASGLVEVLNDKVLTQQTPTLGICLGMQLLTRRSEEGKLPGLGWIDGETVRFRFDETQQDLKIPHMGWNTVTVRREDALFRGLDDDPRFYFVHSYHVVCANEDDVIGSTHRGYDFVSAVRRGNVMGTQFHPEKSHRFGMKLLQNFAEWA
jgi:imidazole glycerol-phosphate synthase subunit HisH